MSIPTPTATVIVPAYNAAATIEACLAGLCEQRLAAGQTLELIVVDDGSSDATARIVAQHTPAVRLTLQANKGPGAARNAGLAAAHAPLVLFTDADCVPTPDWAATLIAGLAGPVVGVKGAYWTRQRSLVARFVQLEYEDKYDRMARQPHIDFIDTYAAGYRRAVIQAQGGFNPTLRYNEDQELSYRVAAAGGVLRFLPQARVYHQHAATTAAYARKKYHIGMWKVRVHADHPHTLAHDSHTPASQKLQMLLAIGAFAVGLLAVALGVVKRGIGGAQHSGQGSTVFDALQVACRLLIAVIGLGFVATAGPFVVKALRRDAAVGLVALPLLAVRAAALGAGFTMGLLGHGGPLVAGVMRYAMRRFPARS